jgi:hypothetical protein
MDKGDKRNQLILFYPCLSPESLFILFSFYLLIFAGFFDDCDVLTRPLGD